MEGPKFLKEDELNWQEKIPGNHTSEDENSEQRKSKSTFATQDAESENDEDRLTPEKFSILTPLLRVTAWIKRFQRNCKPKKSNQRKMARLDMTKSRTLKFTGYGEHKG
jgi:hypothetical protein